MGRGGRFGPPGLGPGMMRPAIMPRTPWQGGNFYGGGVDRSAFGGGFRPQPSPWGGGYGGGPGKGRPQPPRLPGIPGYPGHGGWSPGRMPGPSYTQPSMPWNYGQTNYTPDRFSYGIPSGMRDILDPPDRVILDPVPARESTIPPYRRPMISQPGNPTRQKTSAPDPALSWLATSRDDGVVRGDGNYGTKGEENMPPLAHSSLGGGISREPMPTPLQQPQGPEVGIAGLGRPDHGYQAQQQPAPAHVYRPDGIMNGYRGSPGKANGGIVSAYRQR